MATGLHFFTIKDVQFTDHLVLTTLHAHFLLP